MTQRATPWDAFQESVTQSLRKKWIVSPTIEMALEKAVDAALAAAPEHPAVEMLREIQWSCLDEMEDETCPVCNRYRHNSWFDGHSVPVGHATNCRLAALIKEP